VSFSAPNTMKNLATQFAFSLFTVSVLLGVGFPFATSASLSDNEPTLYSDSNQFDQANKFRLEIPRTKLFKFKNQGGISNYDHHVRTVATETDLADITDESFGINSRHSNRNYVKRGLNPAKKSYCVDDVSFKFKVINERGVTKDKGGCEFVAKKKKRRCKKKINGESVRERCPASCGSRQCTCQDKKSWFMVKSKGKKFRQSCNDIKSDNNSVCSMSKVKRYCPMKCKFAGCSDSCELLKDLVQDDEFNRLKAAFLQKEWQEGITGQGSVTSFMVSSNNNPSSDCANELYKAQSEMKVMAEESKDLQDNHFLFQTAPMCEFEHILNSNSMDSTNGSPFLYNFKTSQISKNTFSFIKEYNTYVYGNIFDSTVGFAHGHDVYLPPEHSFFVSFTHKGSLMEPFSSQDRFMIHGKIKDIQPDVNEVGKITEYVVTYEITSNEMMSNFFSDGLSTSYEMTDCSLFFSLANPCPQQSDRSDPVCLPKLPLINYDPGTELATPVATTPEDAFEEASNMIKSESEQKNFASEGKVPESWEGSYQIKNQLEVMEAIGSVKKWGQLSESVANAIKKIKACLPQDNCSATTLVSTIGELLITAGAVMSAFFPPAGIAILLIGSLMDICAAIFGHGSSYVSKIPALNGAAVQKAVINAVTKLNTEVATSRIEAFNEIVSYEMNSINAFMNAQRVRSDDEKIAKTDSFLQFSYIPKWNTYRSELLRLNTDFINVMRSPSEERESINSWLTTCKKCWLDTSNVAFLWDGKANLNECKENSDSQKEKWELVRAYGAAYKTAAVQLNIWMLATRKALCIDPRCDCSGDNIVNSALGENCTFPSYQGIIDNPNEVKTLMVERSIMTEDTSSRMDAICRSKDARFPWNQMCIQDFECNFRYMVAMPYTQGWQDKIGGDVEDISHKFGYGYKHKTSSWVCQDNFNRYNDADGAFTNPQLAWGFDAGAAEGTAKLEKGTCDDMTDFAATSCSTCDIASVGIANLCPESEDCRQLLSNAASFGLNSSS